MSSIVFSSAAAQPTPEDEAFELLARQQHLREFVGPKAPVESMTMNQLQLRQRQSPSGLSSRTLWQSTSRTTWTPS